jgi:uncharacterized protein (DUF3820 family)
MYTDTTVLSYGKYKFTALCRIPVDYLFLLYNNGVQDQELKEYIEQNMERLMMRKEGLIQPPALKFPCDKWTYITEKEAKKVLAEIRKVDQRHKKPVRAYECDKCGGWHLTSLTLEEYEVKKKDIIQ